MNYYVLRTLEFGPVVLERLVNRIAPADFDTRTDPTRFSLREVVAHLADWEPIFRGRMEAILAQPGILIAGIDEGERAESQKYHTQDVLENLTKLRFERGLTAKLVRSLDDKQLQLACVREEFGPMTIEDIANMMVCHDMYHLEQASGYALSSG